MNSRKIMGGLCLMVMVLSLFAWPDQAAGVIGHQPPYLAQREPFDRLFFNNDISNDQLPQGHNLVEDNFYADRESPNFAYLSGRGIDDDDFSLREEARSLRQLEPKGEQVKPFVFLQPDITGSGDQNRAAGTCTVTSIADSGEGTLRDCLDKAVAGDLITFNPTNFPTGSPQTIALASNLPSIYQDNLTIDASNAGVILDGSAISGNGFGFFIWGAQGVTIQGLQILNFTVGILMGGNETYGYTTYTTIGGDRSVGSGPMGQGNRISGNTSVGVQLQNAGTSNNTIRGNFIGTNLSGDAAVGNGYDGIVIIDGAAQNVIGGDHSPGTCDGACNLISGNTDSGVWIEGAGTSFNTICGNFIGTNLSGTEALANRLGIFIGYGASQNVIGGDHSTDACDGACNLISGNAEAGVWIEGAGTSFNTIRSNFIGTNLSETEALANRLGIFIGYRASQNVIGGDHSADACDGACNLISGNAEAGVWIEGAGTSFNTIRGNFIGTNLAGNAAVGNGFVGIFIGYGASSNVIGGDHSADACDGACNLISGNAEAGVWLEGAGTSQNTIRGNFIGTNLSGNAAVGNGYDGIVILGGAAQNVIGGDHSPGGCDGDCNLISGNNDSGVWIEGAGTSFNTIRGNFIGTNLSGDAAAGNSIGIFIGYAASNNVIGGTRNPGVCDGPCNLVSGNLFVGIVIQNYDSDNNLVQGNLIGTNLSGNAPLPNYNGLVIADGSDNQIGGAGSGEGNLISGNEDTGLWIGSIDTTNNLILGNRIGTDISGTSAVPNYDGILIQFGTGNQVGGVGAGGGNLISGNENVGIYVEYVNPPGITIAGNKIGTNLSGTAALPNYLGILLVGGGGNLIGGTVSGAGNLISGNTEFGLIINTSSANRVQGNTIGADLSGGTAIPNREGIDIRFAACNNMIGGASSGMGNLISGNTENGVYIQNETSVGNQVLGNRIGTNRTGTSALPNDYGIVVIGARETVIGGADLGTPWVCDGPCNLISGNTAFGIMNQGVSAGGEPPPGTVDTASQIIGNFIGTDLSGTAPIPNLAGVDLSWQAGGNQVGGSSALGEGNLLSGNQIDGVVIRDGWANNNQVSGNRIGTTADGNGPLPHGETGVKLYGGASSNLIGGEGPGLGNLISGNVQDGVWLEGVGTTNNQIIKNRIGTNAAGTGALPNGGGIALVRFASDTDLRDNVLSGNIWDGIYLSESTGNQIVDNRIGVAADGISPLPNGRDGIVLLSAPENILGPGNIVAYNRYGIAIVYPESYGNTITQNSIYANQLEQIAFFDMPVPLAPAPTLMGWDADTMTVSGSACAGCSVEVFANQTSTPAGRTYLGTTTAAWDGSFSLKIDEGYIYLAATATNAEGTTSEFSNVLQIGEDTQRIFLPLVLK
jgi:parallel beta-helix repeat protein